MVKLVALHGMLGRAQARQSSHPLERPAGSAGWRGRGRRETVGFATLRALGLPARLAVFAGLAKQAVAAPMARQPRSRERRGGRGRGFPRSVSTRSARRRRRPRCRQPNPAGRPAGAPRGRRAALGRLRRAHPTTRAARHYLGVRHLHAAALPAGHDSTGINDQAQEVRRRVVRSPSIGLWGSLARICPIAPELTKPRHVDDPNRPVCERSSDAFGQSWCFASASWLGCFTKKHDWHTNSSGRLGCARPRCCSDPRRRGPRRLRPPRRRRSPRRQQVGP